MSNSADNKKAAAVEQKHHTRQRQAHGQHAQNLQAQNQHAQNQHAQGPRGQNQRAKPVQEQHEAHLEDEEKVLAGRHDVNYPALLTKDVPGG